MVGQIWQWEQDQGKQIYEEKAQWPSFYSLLKNPFQECQAAELELGELPEPAKQNSRQETPGINIPKKTGQRFQLSK